MHAPAAVFYILSVSLYIPEDLFLLLKAQSLLKKYKSAGTIAA